MRRSIPAALLVLTLAPALAACSKAPARATLEVIEIVPAITAMAMTAGPDEVRPLTVNTRSPGLAELVHQGGRIELAVGPCDAAPGPDRFELYLNEQSLDRVDAATRKTLDSSYYASLRAYVRPALLHQPSRCATITGRDGAEVTSNSVPLPRFE